MPYNININHTLYFAVIARYKSHSVYSPPHPLSIVRSGDVYLSSIFKYGVNASYTYSFVNYTLNPIRHPVRTIMVGGT